MTYILKDVIDRLRTGTNLANAFGDMIFGPVIPQKDKGWKQAITVSVISTEPVAYLGGEAGRHRTQIQVDVWTDGSGGDFRLNELRELVRNRLSGFRGTIGTGSYGTIRMTNDNSGAVAPQDGSDNHYRHCTIDFEVIHSADVPTFA